MMGVDFSHKINKFRLGKTTSTLTYLQKYFPDIIKINPLDNVEYMATGVEKGHSSFIYETNILGTKYGSNIEMMYNFYKNTVTLP